MSMLRVGSFESKVASVGSGFGGAAIAARLLRSTQVNVAVIEDRPRLGLGLAYRDAQDFQILNCSGGPHEFLGRTTNAVSRLAETARTPAWTARSPVGHCGEPPLQVHGCLSLTLRLCRLFATLRLRADKLCCRVIRHRGFATFLTTPGDGGRNVEAIVQTTIPGHELREDRGQGPYV